MSDCTYIGMVDCAKKTDKMRATFKFLNLLNSDCITPIKPVVKFCFEIQALAIFAGPSSLAEGCLVMDGISAPIGASKCNFLRTFRKL